MLGDLLTAVCKYYVFFSVMCSSWIFVVYKIKDKRKYFVFKMKSGVFVLILIYLSGVMSSGVLPDGVWSEWGYLQWGFVCLPMSHKVFDQDGITWLEVKFLTNFFIIKSLRPP